MPVGDIHGVVAGRELACGSRGDIVAVAPSVGVWGGTAADGDGCSTGGIAVTEHIDVGVTDFAGSQLFRLADGVLHCDFATITVAYNHFIVASSQTVVGHADCHLSFLITIQLVQVFPSIKWSASACGCRHGEGTGFIAMAVHIRVTAACGNEGAGIVKGGLFCGMTVVGIGDGYRIGAGRHTGENVGGAVALVIPLKSVGRSSSIDRGRDFSVVSIMTGGVGRGERHRRLCVHCYGDILRGLAGEVVVRFAADDGNFVAASSVRLKLFSIIVACNIFHIQTSGS